MCPICASEPVEARRGCRSTDVEFTSGYESFYMGVELNLDSLDSNYLSSPILHLFSDVYFGAHFIVC